MKSKPWKIDGEYSGNRGTDFVIPIIWRDGWRAEFIIVVHCCAEKRVTIMVYLMVLGKDFLYMYRACSREAGVARICAAKFSRRSGGN